MEYAVQAPVRPTRLLLLPAALLASCWLVQVHTQVSMVLLFSLPSLCKSTIERAFFRVQC